MIYHLTVILLCQLAGEFLSQSLDLIVPGPVLGMIFLLALFLSAPKIAAAIQPTALGLLSHLSLLFVPAGVGIIGHLEQLGSDGIPILIALGVSTALAITVAALVFVGVNRLVGGGK